MPKSQDKVKTRGKIKIKPYKSLITEPHQVGNPFSLMFQPMLFSPDEQNIKTKKERKTSKKQIKKNTKR